MFVFTRFLVPAVVALMVVQTTSAQETGGNKNKNEIDISGFSGNYFGKSKVTANGETFRGRVKVSPRFEQDGLAGRFKIDGNVRVDGEKVPVGNFFNFRKNGRVDVDELAPAVSSNAKEKGFFFAKPRNISVTGQFRLDGSDGRIEGTYEGSFKINKARVVRITYTVTLEGDTEPAFTYKYVAKPKKK